MMGLQPAQTLIPNRTVRSDHRLVAGDPFDLGQLRRGDVLVFLDGRDAGAVGRLGAALELGELFVRDSSGLPAAGSDRAVPPERESDEADDDEENRDVERRSGLSVRHVLDSRLIGLFLGGLFSRRPEILRRLRDGCRLG